MWTNMKTWLCSRETYHNDWFLSVQEIPAQIIGISARVRVYVMRRTHVPDSRLAEGLCRFPGIASSVRQMPLMTVLRLHVVCYLNKKKAKICIHFPDLNKESNNRTEVSLACWAFNFEIQWQCFKMLTESSQRDDSEVKCTYCSRRGPQCFLMILGDLHVKGLFETPPKVVTIHRLRTAALG